MDYEKYQKLQADLGGVGAEFQSSVKNIIQNSDADQHTKDLVNTVCAEIAKSLDQVAIYISNTAQLMTK